MKKPKTAVLLINVGSPTAPTTPAVRRYLREFLSDPRVIDIPAVARWLLLNVFILPFRPKSSAALYRNIWQADGSPLITLSMTLRDKLQAKLGEHYYVGMAMRYGQPSIANILDTILEQQCNDLVVIPLYPQYSSAASGSAIEKTLALLAKRANIPRVRVIHEFYNESLFIDSYVSTIRHTLNNSAYDYLLFSYHGVPERQIEKTGCNKTTCQRQAACPAISDNNRFCYRAQCYATSQLIAKQLKLNEQQYGVAFQSRLGKTVWISPYTDFVLPELANKGIKKLAIACPSFVTDCLETLEEIGIRAREQWASLGGEELHLIPCPNTDDRWVNALVNMIKP